MSFSSLHRLSSPAILGCTILLAFPLPAALAVPPAKTNTTAKYAKIPLSFEANQGQAGPAVEFLSHGHGYTLGLSHGNATFALMRSGTKAGAARVQITLARANSSAYAIREEQQITRTNYFTGNDPKQWHTNIPNYARVKYNSIYPGIDLVYYGNQQRLEHDFIVAPGADPSQISFTISGASHTRIDPVTGDLTLSTDSGELRFLKPESYQRLGSRQTPVASSYRLLARNKIAFRIGRYNHTQPLIIDPVLTYATFLDGSTAEYLYGLAVDTSGNSYLTGSTQSTDFPTTTGAYSTTDSATYRAAFVSKLNAAGTALIYSTFLGGGHSNSGLAIAVNTAGEAYLTGTGDTSAYPTTSSAFQKTSYGYDNAVFVTKLSAAGDSLVYSTYLGNGGNGGDTGNAIAVDAAGNAYVTGRAYGGSFPSTAVVLQPGPGYGANSSAFVAKINPNGSSLVYSTYLGGSTFDTIGYAIQIDSAGDAYVGGSTDSADFPTTAGAFQTVNHSSSSTNGFVSKLNPTGTALLYSTFLGGSSRYGDSVNGLAIDSAGDAFAVGATDSTDFPVTAGALQTTDPGATVGSQSGFVSKLNPNGTALIYSTYLGSSGTGYPGDSGNAVAVDSSGNAYVTGQTASTGFPTTPGALQTASGNNLSVNGTNPVGTGGFFIKLNAEATAAIYSTYLGGTGLALAVDGSGDALIAGDTTYGFITTKNAFQTTTASIYPTAIFALKLAIGKGTPAETGTAVTLTSTNSTFLSNRPSTFIATVKPTALTAIPTGFVRFDSEAGSATIPLDGSGMATYTTSALPLGFDIVLATYTGSPSYDPSNANLEAIVTTNDTLNVTVTPNTLVAGQPVNFLAAVTSSGTKAVATGTVSFQFGSGNPVVVPLNASGQASYTMTAPPTQTLAYLSVTVSYSGDTNFDPISGMVFYYQELPPALSLLSGGNQKVLYGNPFPAPIVVQALGLNNVPLTGTTINFSGDGLSFNPANAVTDANGKAQTFVNPTAAGYLTASATVANSGSVIGIPLLSGEVNLKVSSPRTTVFYGNPIPALGYYFEGFVNGDTAATAVTGAPIVTTNATAQSPAGTYKIFVNLGTLAARGYNFGLATSLLDIHTAPLQLTATSFTIHKGDPIPTLTYTLSGFVYGQDASVVSGAPVLTTTATSSSSPGRYAIHIRHGSLTAQNYAFIDVPGVLTILP